MDEINVNTTPSLVLSENIVMTKCIGFLMEVAVDNVDNDGKVTHVQH